MTTRLDPRWLQGYTASAKDDGVDACVFCAIIQGEAESHVITETADTLAFLDRAPATWGHTLVVSKRHSRDLFDIPDDTYQAVMATAKQVAHALRTSCAATGINLVHASGKSVHQTEWHFHVHVVPRYEGDDIVVFPRLADPEMRAEAAARLRSSLAPTSLTEPTESSTVTTAPDALDHFTEQGYLLLKQAVPAATVEALDNAILGLSPDRAGDLTHASFNTNPALTQVRDAANRMPDYQRLFASHDLMEIISQILNGSVQVLGSEALRRGIFDHAHEVWHRDSGSYLERPYDDVNGPLHLKAQVFFTDTRPVGSGNLVLIPGSHRWPVGHRDAMYWQEANAALAHGHVPDGALIVRAEPGDAVIFGNTMWHAVLPNRIQERRSAIIRFGQTWLRPYDHTSDPADAADHLTPETRRLMGYFPPETNPVDLYKPVKRALDGAVTR